MATWDQRSAAALVKLRNQLVREQVRDVVGPFSPFYRERFAALGVKPSAVTNVADLRKLPAVGERDVCPDGDAARAAALVVQANETDYAMSARGPAFRKALIRRVVDVNAYRRHVESDTRATSYGFDGLAFSFPIASTRSDLDVVARAGARLWRVLGLTAADIAVVALPPQRTPTRTALEYAALASRMPAFFVGQDPMELAAALRLVPATVLALPSAEAAGLVDELADLGARLDELTTVLLVGAPTPAEREAVRQALTFAGRGSVVTLGVHAPSGARVLWGECRESVVAGASAGYHTYPDLDVVELVDPETGGETTGNGQDTSRSELVLTQLGLRGSALVRWRTGDLVAGVIATGRCPTCRRSVPRVSATLLRAALVPAYAPAPTSGSHAGHVDLRAFASALVGHPDVADWRIVLRTSARHGADELLVHLVPGPAADPAELAVTTARDLRTAAGRLPSQVVLAGPADIARIDANPQLVRLTPRLAVRAAEAGAAAG